MRAFLSHSSVDKNIVIAVYEGLERESAWLDRAEIEWGDLFVEKISEGIESASDFVLFWSEAASKSEWVRVEVNMAFILRLRTKAIRLRVIRLDDTPLPLYLQTFHVFSISKSTAPAADILQKLVPILREPVRSARASFINRNGDIERLEAAVDDPEFRAVWVVGFTGVGKKSLVEETVRRLFEGAKIVRLDVGQGTGFVELALELCAAARSESLPVGLNQEQLEADIRLSIEILAKDGRLLLLANVQHWLDEDGRPQGALSFLLRVAQDLVAFEKRPLFLTSTRRPTLDANILAWLSLVGIRGLSDRHTASLVRNWFVLIHDRELSVEDAAQIAPKLYGHPVAARLAAGLLGNQTANFLETYPQKLIALRRDLARVLVEDLNLDPGSERLMETLALASAALPASVIVASGIPEEEFQNAVAQCAAAGLITADVSLETHPLFHDFFWHRLHRGNYQELALRLADAAKSHLDTSADRTSLEFASLLLVAFRSYGMAGDLARARALRHDLSGELEATAITLYNRRNYALADDYIQHLLDENPKNWRMRLYRARIRVRNEQWDEAEQILQQMLKERPEDPGVLHALGWSQLKQHHLTEALDIFTRVIARREHVASLRDAAECLHRLQRTDEALKFLERAKKKESENPWVLDLESLILEDLDQLDPAYDAAYLASQRDPTNAHMHNRLGIIRAKQKRPDLAIDHFKKAMELDQDQFSPANSLASAYLDLGNLGDAINLLPELKAKARTPSNSALLRHTEARIALARKEFDQSKEILKREIAQDHNVVPNLGLLLQVEFATFDKNLRDFPAIAMTSLNAAETTLERIVALESANKLIPTFRSQVAERRESIARTKSKRTSLTGHPGVPGLPANLVPHSPAPEPAAPGEKASDPKSKVPATPPKKAVLKPPLSPPRKS